MRIALCMLVTLMIPFMAHAKKKKKGVVTKVDGKSWKGPFISVKLNSKFNNYLDRRDNLMKELDEIDEIDDTKDSTQKSTSLSAWKDDIADVSNDIAKKLKTERRSITREINTLEKTQLLLDKELEKAGENQKMIDQITAKVTAADKRLSELAELSKAYGMFEKYCTKDQTGLAGTALGLVDQRTPDIKGKTFDGKDFDLDQMEGDYKVILFCSMLNRDSAAGIREAFRINGKKVYGKKVKAVFVNVDRGEKNAVERKAYITKTFRGKAPVLVDETNDLCAAYKVNFLPQAVLVNGKGVVVRVVIAHKIYSRFYDTIKNIEKKKR